MRWFALLCFVMLGYAWRCYALLYFPLLCFDFEAGPSPSPGPPRICEKFTQCTQQLDPNRKFHKQMPFSAPFVGGTTAGPEKWKIRIKKQEETIMKNPRTIFEVQVPEIVGKSSISLFVQSKSSKKWGYARIRLEKNSGTQESGSTKIAVRTMLLLFFSSQNRAYHHFLEPESCVPRFFSTKIVVRTISATPSSGHPLDRQFL